jgi:hypothetical protein
LAAEAESPTTAGPGLGIPAVAGPGLGIPAASQKILVFVSEEAAEEAHDMMEELADDMIIEDD